MVLDGSRLGGYVKISGMIDESMDTDQMALPAPKPWEFRSKPAWQRLIIMLGGVFVNFVLGIFIYIMLNVVLMAKTSCQTIAYKAVFGCKVL